MQSVRGHNEGTILRNRRTGKFVACVTMPDGSRPTKACPHKHSRPELRPGSRECDEARANLRELLRLRDAGAPPNAHRLTLAEYLQRWLVDVRPSLAPATWRKHESIARVHLAPRLGHRLLSELSVGDVRRYLSNAARAETMAGGLRADRPASLAGQTVRHHRATLRRALADAVRDGLTVRNVAALAEAPKLGQRERTVLTAAQARAFVDGTRDDRLHALWVLLLTTGIREAEALGLTWDAIEGNAVTVRHTLQRCDGRCDQHDCLNRWQLREPKTVKSRRSVPLPPMTVTALETHRRRQLEEQAARGELGRPWLVFTTPRGLPIHGSNLLPAWYAALARLGLPRVTIHDARHSAATILFAAGVPLPVISDMLGHSTIRVTSDLYRHRVPELSRDAAERMERALG